MKKTLFLLLLFIANVNAQNQYNYGFSGDTAAMTAAGWVRNNQSTLPSTTALWSVASYSVVAAISTATPANPFQTVLYTTGQSCPIPLDQTGANNSFAIVNYRSTTSTTAATISNWLQSPVITVQNGDVISFYNRLGKYSATNTASYPDNLQLRMSTTGAATVAPSTGPTDVGSYTNLLIEINPTLNTSSYPCTWTQYSYTVSGLTGATDCKFAFRYYVTNGGSGGANSDIIGIDTFSVDRNLSKDSFFMQNFAIFPNPTTDILNIENKTGVEITNFEITDLNGRIVKNNSQIINNQINISDLHSGVYFLRIIANEGIGTSKIIKK